MSEKPQGGPAFPCVIGDIYYKGMTLRDYFAGQSLLSAAVMSVVAPNAALKAEDVAAAAYRMADAMIAAREQ